MKAIITDLDRTLLHTDKSVSEYTIDILRKCHEHNILVMSASARPLRDIRLFNDLIMLDGAAASNGAVIELPDGIREFGIPRTDGEKILAELMRFPDVFISFETDRGLFSNRDIPEWEPMVYDKLPKLPSDIVLYKILVSSEHNSVYENIGKLLTDNVYYTVSNHELIQIMSRDATKWNAVLHMLAFYGVSPKDAVYFGDDNDDIEPLEKCGIGVAVSNAIPSALNAADRITADNDSDGVAKFIRDYILE